MPTASSGLNLPVACHRLKGEYPIPEVVLRQPRRNHRRRRVSVVRRFLRFFFFSGVFALLLGFAFSPWIRSAAAAVLPGASPEETFGSRSIRLLLLGADRDYTPEGKRLDSPGRADTMIVADINLVEHKVHMCSIPRDTRAYVPGYGHRKINAAYALGGPELARSSVQKLIGAPIDRVVAVDLDGFREAVDAIGGVKINVEKPMRYDDNWGDLHIDLKAGEQVLDGEHAMQYVRFRHDATSDIGRSRRQQEFVRAFAAKAARPTSIGALPSVIQSVRNHLHTDLTSGEMIALSRLAREVDGNVTTGILPGRLHGSGWQPDCDAARRMFAKRAMD